MGRAGSETALPFLLLDSKRRSQRECLGRVGRIADNTYQCLIRIVRED
jgi:hypothetical protein